MINEQDAQTLEAILREVMPGPCDSVGRANIRDIIRTGGNIQVVPLSGASRTDWHDLLTKLAAGAALLSHGLAVLRHLNERKRQTPTEISAEIKLSLPKELADKLEPEAIEKLLTRLIEKR